MKTLEEDIRRMEDVSAWAGREKAFPKRALWNEEVRRTVCLSRGQFQESRFDSDKQEKLAGELGIGRVPVGVGGPWSLRKS